MRETLLDVRGLALQWPHTNARVLHGIDLAVGAGELVAVLGANGSGKSTLLRCIVRLLIPTSGSILVAGHDLGARHGDRLRRARRNVGLISQRANLVARRSVLANVACGTLGAHDDLRTKLGMLPAASLDTARRALTSVGLGALAERRAGTLSGGQAQRVAIARALAQNPRVLLADEPIASLDPDAATDVLALLRRLANDGLAVVVVLHQPDLALAYADRIVGLRDGSVAFDDRALAADRAAIGDLYRGERVA